MPNHCTNSLTIYSKDKELLKKLHAKATVDEPAGDLLDFLAPLPNGEWDYNWCVANWGTKWDIYDVCYAEIEEDRLDLGFCTAWEPPVEALQTGAERLGFTFELYYHEGGMMFAGMATDETDDCYTYTFERHPSEEIRQDILGEFEFIETDYDDYVMDAEDSELTDDQKEYRKMLREDVKEYAHG